MYDRPSQEFILGDAEVRAFFQAIAPHIVALLPPDGLHVGTGTLIRWKSSHVILTANHNLGEVRPSAMRFVLYPGGTLREGAMSDCRDSSTLSRGLLLQVEDDVVADGENDIVAIPLNTDQLPKSARCYEIGTEIPVVRDGNTVMLAGFAWDNSFALQGQARAVGVTTQTGQFSSALNSMKGLSSSYNPQKHFLLPYTRLDDGVSPYGISGTAAWCNAESAAAVWAPRPLLVGVQTAWFPRSKYLQIVGLKPILSLLAKLAG